ncbi:DUF3152 domain-containing protein [Streptomyces sp. KR80]|uniref:DUF3152 domain-containing protein n=1 Tax=Streptomyces sp. KR80 TaxID=3457426 RepID=UPI003FD55929
MQPPVRGGHPEHRERGGAWGRVPPPAQPAPPRGTPAYGARPRAAGQPGGRGPGPNTSPRGATAGAFGRAGGQGTPPRGFPAHGAEGTGTGPVTAAGAFIPRPRQEFIDAFDDEVYGSNPPGRRGERTTDADSPGEGYETGWDEGDETTDSEDEAGRAGGKGRTFTGVAAAAVTTVLAVVVAGQVTGVGTDRWALPSTSEVPREVPDDTSRSDRRPAPSKPPAEPATYAQKMAAVFPLDPRLAGSGDFKTIGGRDKAPGEGQVVSYRVDMEKGLRLDGELFAEAVHKTLNDARSWGHGGIRTFERVSKGDADWVITLASPGTTADWCAKSGLDTTVDNVSCDSASTERVMINAYRWAQGAETFGDDKMYSYREMLINHEVGHRLGRNHVGCSEQGALAPVMMQQTKYLATDGVICKPNPWPFPKG